MFFNISEPQEEEAKDREQEIARQLRPSVRNWE